MSRLHNICWDFHDGEELETKRRRRSGGRTRDIERDTRRRRKRKMEIMRKIKGKIKQKKSEEKIFFFF